MRHDVTKLVVNIKAIFNAKPLNAAMTTRAVCQELENSRKVSTHDVFFTLTHMEQLGHIKMIGRDRQGRWLWQRD